MVGLTESNRAAVTTHELLRAMLMDANSMTRRALEPDREKLLRAFKETLDKVSNAYGRRYAGMSCGWGGMPCVFYFFFTVFPLLEIFTMNFAEDRLTQEGLIGAIAEHLFSDRVINWGRVVALCAFVRTASIRLVNCGVADSFHVEKMARALADCLVSQRTDWMIANEALAKNDPIHGAYLAQDTSCDRPPFLHNVVFNLCVAVCKTAVHYLSL